MSGGFCVIPEASGHFQLVPDGSRLFWNRCGTNPLQGTAEPAGASVKTCRRKEKMPAGQRGVRTNVWGAALWEARSEKGGRRGAAGAWAAPSRLVGTPCQSRSCRKQRRGCPSGSFPCPWGGAGLCSLPHASERWLWPCGDWWVGRVWPSAASQACPEKLVLGWMTQPNNFKDNSVLQSKVTQKNERLFLVYLLAYFQCMFRTLRSNLLLTWVYLIWHEQGLPDQVLIWII